MDETTSLSAKKFAARVNKEIKLQKRLLAVTKCVTTKTNTLSSINRKLCEIKAVTESGDRSNWIDIKLTEAERFGR